MPSAMWDEDENGPDISFRRQLWAAFGLFALLVMASLGTLTYLYLGALRDKALSMAIAGEEETASQVAKIVQDAAEGRQAEGGQADLYTIVRDRQEVDAVIGRRQTVESWQILDAKGEAIASSIRLRDGGQDPEARFGDPPRRSRQVITIDKELLLDGQKAGLVRLFLSEPDVMVKVEEFQRDVRLRVLAGAGFTLVLLLATFGYVVRLLERTRRIHDQAETRLRLASLGELAGGLAHEIRNPLNAMNMNMQLLEEEMASSDLSQQHEWRSNLATTRREIKRLDSLVTDVLTYARPWAADKAPVDVAMLLADLLAFLERDLLAHDVNVERSGDLGVVLPADGPKLRQAFLNVLRNSVQAFDGRAGERRIRIAASSSGPLLRVTIEDNGPGIPPQERREVFRAFASRKAGGTGLGLPIARKILRAHGGDLLVEDAAPRGTRVVFLLPLS